MFEVTPSKSCDFMDQKAAHWIVFYQQAKAECSMSFTFQGMPTMADVAKIISATWGAAGIVLPFVRGAVDTDAAAREFLKSHGINRVAFMPFIERRKVARP